MSFWGGMRALGQTALDVAGVIPLYGEVTHGVEAVGHVGAGIYDYATGDSAEGNVQMGEAAWHGLNAIPAVHEALEDTMAGAGEIIYDGGMTAARFAGASSEDTPLAGSLPGHAFNAVTGFEDATPPGVRRMLQEQQGASPAAE